MEMSGELRPRVALPTGKEPPYPLDGRLGGPQSRSGRCGGEKNLALSGIEPGPPNPHISANIFLIVLYIQSSHFHRPTYNLLGGAESADYIQDVDGVTDIRNTDLLTRFLLPHASKQGCVNFLL
jgi:hypothetical protein